LYETNYRKRELVEKGSYKKIYGWHQENTSQWKYPNKTMYPSIEVGLKKSINE